MDAFSFDDTPLSYLLTTLAAEKVLSLEHTFSKSVNLAELVGFFAMPLAERAPNHRFPRFMRMVADARGT